MFDRERSLDDADPRSRYAVDGLMRHSGRAVIGVRLGVTEPDGGVSPSLR